MLVSSKPAWQIRVDRWSWALDVALWIRAAERIEVQPDNVVTGMPEIDPWPEPSTSAVRADELATGWLTWWRTLTQTQAERGDPSHPETAFGPSAFTGLADWPTLQALVVARWPQAYQWHNQRKRAGLEDFLHDELKLRTNSVVADVERALGRPAQPFLLDIVLLPVIDDQIRTPRPGRYLVPERLYDGPDWPPALTALVNVVA